MKACLRFAPMIGSREGELSAEDSRALAAHLAECPSCSALAADVAATEGMLQEALLAKANARDFGPFVDQVMARVGNVTTAGAQSPAAGRGGAARAWAAALATLRGHWKLFTATAVAALAALSVFMYVERDVQEEPEQLASLEVDLEGGSTVLQTSDGPVVLLEPDESGS
jgi:anti-sigma factor RsiW